MSEFRVGLAVRNFAPAPESPSIDEIIDFARQAETLGFDSLWAWDHLLLGSKRPFPFLESLSVLAAIAAVTERIELGTGVLVLPLRNPVVLAKVTATVDLISKGRLLLGVAAGWYEREFEACGVPFAERGRIFERNLDVLTRFWSGEPVTGEAGELRFGNALMLPPPARRPRPTVLIGGYVDRVLRRVATRADGWLTYFYTPESFRRAWGRIAELAREAGRDPDELTNVAQLPICIDASFEKADGRVREFVERYFDVAPWSESTVDSAIRGTVEQCAEQLLAHADAGVRHVALVPCGYELEQVEQIAQELVPAVIGRRAGSMGGSD